MSEVEAIVCHCERRFPDHPAMYEHVREHAALDEPIHGIKEIVTKTGGPMHQTETDHGR